MSRGLIWLAAFCLAAAPSLGEAEPHWLDAAFPGDASPSSGAVTADDLVRVRRLGGMGVSPDGRRVAFAVYQALPEEDRYRLHWFVQPADGGRPPAPVFMDGGQPIPILANGMPHAAIAPMTPYWSPDSSQFAIKRQDGAGVELWVVDVEAATASLVSGGGGDVEDVAWTGGGELHWRSGIDQADFQRGVEAEAKHGWLLDERAWRVGGSLRPRRPRCGGSALNEAGCDGRSWSWSRAQGLRQLTPDASGASVGGGDSPMIGLSALFDPLPEWTQVSEGPGGSKAGFERTTPDEAAGFMSERRVGVQTSRAVLRCAAASCLGVQLKQIGWWDDRTIWFTRGEDTQGRVDGAPFDQTSAYLWRIDESEPQKLATADWMGECQRASSGLICARETLFSPRHLVLINGRDASASVLADFNPEFATKLTPRVDRIRLADIDGNPGTAYLIWPTTPSHTRSPLVVTQYRQRGFLDGQVGGEYPLLALAARGYFVLSIDQTEYYNLHRSLPPMEIMQRSVVGLDERRRVLAVTEQAIEAALATGMIDDQRIAITGLSAGAEATHFALQRTDRFAAAIASGGAYDRSAFALMPPGPTRDMAMRMFQTGDLYPGDESLLAQLSWTSLPTAQLQTPLLINAGEYEANFGFEGVARLQQAQRPLEMRIFPDETHIKYHPRALMGVMENNLMWLDFWLRDVEDDQPRFVAQYARWRTMRDALHAERGDKRRSEHRQ